MGFAARHRSSAASQLGETARALLHDCGVQHELILTVCVGPSAVGADPGWSPLVLS